MASSNLVPMRSSQSEFVPAVRPAPVASDVRKVRGLGGKPSSEIFAGITRWIKAKAITRKARGFYRQMG